MSRSRAIKAIKFEPIDMIPSMEYTTGLSRQNLLAVTGIDPLKNYKDSLLRLIELMEIDIHGPLPDEKHLSVSENIESLVETDIPQQADWGLTQGTKVLDGARKELSLDSPESVLRFEPLEWDQRSEDELFNEFSIFHRRNLNMFGKRCLAEEDIYTTLFHWCIDTFGWENFMLAAAMDEKRFEEILLQFKELSIRRTKAWARVEGLEFFMCHDDLCMTRGPVFAPNWYRKYIFPHYHDIMTPIKQSGIPIIFTSDGNYLDMADDIVACGYDGLVFEQAVDIKAMIKKFGGRIILIGGPDIRILTLGSVEDVKKHLKEVFSIVKGIPGYFYSTSGSLTSNIPYENLRTYIDLSVNLRAEVC